MDDQSGYAVSLSSDGTVVAIGVFYNDNSSGENAGHVRVYEYTITPAITQDIVNITGNTLTDGTAILTSGLLTGNVTGNVTGHLFGNVTATTVTDGTATLTSGTLTANCIQYDDISIIQANTITLASGTTTSWNQLGDAIEGEAQSDQFGYSVSLSSDGTIVAISGRLNDDAASDSGHVRVYEWDGISWNQLGDDIDGEAANDYFGSSVSLSSDGTVVAIGAR